jgi:3-hydroxybutyryl-CoA dehydrogenase
MDIKKMGVIGAGQMGTGIAQVCALAGIEIALNDISESRINAGLATIAGNLTRLVERKQIEPSARDAALNRITPASDFDAFGDSDLILEAATENEEVKRKIFTRLCPSLKPTAILATNTSSISITRLASVTDRP